MGSVPVHHAAGCASIPRRARSLLRSRARTPRDRPPEAGRSARLSEPPGLVRAGGLSGRPGRRTGLTCLKDHPMSQPARLEAPDVAEEALAEARPCGAPAVDSPSPDSEAADLVLVQRAQQGDMPAYDELVRRYQERVYATIYHMTGNHEDAGDL